MWYHYFIKHWGHIALFHIVTLDLSESKRIFSPGCQADIGSTQARPVASWKDSPVLSTRCHTIAILSPDSGTEERDFNIHKRYFVGRYPGPLSRGDPIYLMARILFLNRKLLNDLGSFIIYQTSVHSGPYPVERQLRIELFVAWWPLVAAQIETVLIGSSLGDTAGKQTGK